MILITVHGIMHKEHFAKMYDVMKELLYTQAYTMV